MNRGELVTVALSGDFGKQRPALVIQAKQFEEIGTVTVLLLSGTLVDAPLIRVMVQPMPVNGLNKPSQVIVDKVMTVKRERLGPVFGRLDDETMLAVTRTLAVFLGIA
jgi:mRNA interferase MazF